MQIRLKNRYETDQGTKVFQTGVLVKNQPHDHCPPGASVSERGYRCDPKTGKLIKRQDDSDNETDLPPAPQPDTPAEIEDSAPIAPAESEDSVPIAPAEDDDSVPIAPAEVAEDIFLQGGHPSSSDKVIVVPKGGYSFNTPDCFRVEVTYSAGFQGFEPKVKVTKIKGCKPHHPHCRGGNCHHPGAPAPGSKRA